MTAGNHSAEPLVGHTCLLGEGPVWNAKQRMICWVDILSGTIHEYSTTTGQHRMIEVGDLVGSFAFCTDGNYLAALKHGLAYVDRSTERIKMLFNPEIHLAGNRFNEGKCDPAGRFWAGSMALTEEQGKGNLYMVRRDLSYSTKLTGVSISNGLAWSIDEKTLYYIDSPTRQVAAFDFDKQSGELSRRRVAISVPEKEGFPDGMTIDTEGMLWIGHWDGWQVARWNPHTGKKLLSIRLPVSRVTSCTFGGDKLDDLYITTAKIGLSDGQVKMQPLAGALFVVRNSGFTGFNPVEFDLKSSDIKDL